MVELKVGLISWAKEAVTTMVCGIGALHLPAAPQCNQPPWLRPRSSSAEGGSHGEDSRPDRLYAAELLPVWNGEAPGPLPERGTAQRDLHTQPAHRDAHQLLHSTSSTHSLPVHHPSRSSSHVEACQVVTCGDKPSQAASTA